MKRFRIFLAAIPLIAAAPAAFSADPIPLAYDPKVAFAESDGNNDGAIDPPEFYERMTEVFYLGDADKDGKLDPAEYDAVVVIREEFGAVDRSGDGKVTLIEFFRARDEVFEQVDANHDGSLSEEEVVVGFRGEGAPGAEKKP